ncbi:hypothetical protein [Nostoc sp. JL33]|uniref:hypothetical protein n=1 Tax=Nostoc sp. JL33 TaxID=2815396 RepID=UPI0025F38FE4|nr:hypothetical protein [Nostoc sp. JL33]MBN3868844.1 hypothetical protein [Nostoc sp. JL33]
MSTFSDTTSIQVSDNVWLNILRAIAVRALSYSASQVQEVDHIKTLPRQLLQLLEPRNTLAPQPLSLPRRGEIKHSFIGVRLSCT